jgi:very-short-patch-repair endonuclease
MRELIRHIIREQTRGVILEMPKKLTKDEFIAKAKGIHGDKYDYSEVEYQSNQVPVTIICPIHGPFPQKPGSHLMGKGCKPCGYQSKTEKTTFWTKEEVMKEVSKYENLNDFRTLSGGAYASAIKNGWLEDVRKNFVPKKIDWTLDKLRDITSQYDNIKDFRRDHYNAYHALIRKGLLYDFTSHMTRPNEWSDEDIENEARKYNSIRDFSNASPNMYMLARRRGLMPKFKKFLSSKVTYWTDEMLEKEALKYNSFAEFAIQSPGAYQTAIRRGIYGKITSHFQEKVYSGELYIENVLDKNKIEYNKQHTFLDCNNQRQGSSCKKLPFDFYLPKYNCCIEYDGEQHFKPKKFFGGEEGFLRRQQLDKIKDQYCKDNGIKLIRIPYTMKKQDIEPYILSELGM